MVTFRVVEVDRAAPSTFRQTLQELNEHSAFAEGDLFKTKYEPMCTRITAQFTELEQLYQRMETV